MEDVDNATITSSMAYTIKFFRKKKFPGRGGQRECAEALGLHVKQLAGWESGARNPGRNSLRKLAAVFGTDIDRLLDQATVFEKTQGDARSGFGELWESVRYKNDDPRFVEHFNGLLNKLHRCGRLIGDPKYQEQASLAYVTIKRLVSHLEHNWPECFADDDEDLIDAPSVASFDIGAKPPSRPRKRKPKA